MIVGVSIRLGIHSSGSQNTLEVDSKFERRRGARVDNVPAGDPGFPNEKVDLGHSLFDQGSVVPSAHVGDVDECPQICRKPIVQRSIHEYGNELGFGARKVHYARDIKILPRLKLV